MTRTPGWLKAPRSMFDADDPIWNSHEPFDSRSARFDLLQMARFAPGPHSTHYGTDMLERGELVASVRYLAERWRWGKSRVSRFLKRCIEDGFLSRQRAGHHGDVYVIVGYDSYQGATAERGTPRGTGLGQVWDKEEEGKNGKNVRRTTCPSDVDSPCPELPLAATDSPAEHHSSQGQRSSNPVRARGRRADEGKESWLAPIGAAWEAEMGRGTFPWKKAAGLLCRLHRAGVPSEEIAANLARYLGKQLDRNGGKYISLARFAETFATWNDPGPLVDASGVLTPHGMAVLRGDAA